MRNAFGKVIDDILIHMEGVANDQSPIRLHMTACHDTTLIALLCAMGGFDEKWIPLASYLSFELYLDDSVIFNCGIL